jgi:hypothetical protein
MIEKTQKTQTNFLALFAIVAFFVGVYSIFSAYAEFTTKRCLQNPTCIARMESAIAADKLKAATAAATAESEFEIKNISQ